MDERVHIVEAINARATFDWKGDARYRWKHDWDLEYAQAAPPVLTPKGHSLRI